MKKYRVFWLVDVSIWRKHVIKYWRVKVYKRFLGVKGKTSYFGGYIINKYNMAMGRDDTCVPRFSFFNNVHFHKLL